MTFGLVRFRSMSVFMSYPIYILGMLVSVSWLCECTAGSCCHLNPMEVSRFDREQHEPACPHFFAIAESQRGKERTEADGSVPGSVNQLSICVSLENRANLISISTS